MADQQTNNLGPLGNIASGLFNIFGSQNPASAAQPSLDQLQHTMGNYFNPYIQQGQNAYGVLNNQYGQMINDPGGILSRLGSGYQQSPGYKFQVDEATKAANRAAAAGGMLGSPAEQSELAKQITGFANQDFNQYLQNALGLFGGGLSGYGNFYNTGFNATNSLADKISQALRDQAELQYSGTANQNQMQGGGFGSLLGGIGKLFGL